MSDPIDTTEGAMKIIMKDVIELRKQLFYIDTGMFVSITPDEMIDLHPEDSEILDAVSYLVDELYYSIYRELRRPETPLRAPEPRAVRTINDVCFNIIAHAMYELWKYLTLPPDDTVKVECVLKKIKELDGFLMSTFPDPEEDG